MRNLLASAALVSLSLICAAPSLAASPGVGDPAPAFQMKGSDGSEYDLESLLSEHRGVVLAWFPKAFTSGCTEELSSLHANASALAEYDVAIFMVSLDDPDQNRAFAESLGAELTLLSDPEGKVAARYGVLAGSGSYATRTTFYVDAGGRIAHVERNVAAPTHGQDMARNLERLGFPRKTRSEPNQSPVTD